MSTISDLPGVRDISWQEGSDHITITTDTMVQSPGHTGCVCVRAAGVCVWSQVVLYPLETCSTAGSCEECTGSFPLCGWCTVENKCSRRSQCRDSSEPRRWVSSSDQCITSTLTPDQFTLAAPSIVRAVSLSLSLTHTHTLKCLFIFISVFS